MMKEKLFSIRFLGVKLESIRYQQAAKRSSGSIHKVPRLWKLGYGPAPKAIIRLSWVQLSAHFIR